MKKIINFLIKGLFISFLVLFFSCTQEEEKKEVSQTPVEELSPLLQQKEKEIEELKKKLEEANKETEGFKEKIKELTNRLSSLQSKFNSLHDEWEHRYHRQELVLAIFQIYNYVQQEGHLPDDLSPFLIEKDKWEYIKENERTFTLKSLIYPEIRYRGSISKVEIILRPPGEWKYVGRIIFEEERVAMILNEKTGETRFVKKGEWIETFRVDRIEEEGIYLISPRGKSVIPYTPESAGAISETPESSSPEI